MNSTNPFQISSGYQRDLQQSRRQRFKRTVIAIGAGIAMMLIGLLIQGCMSEHAKTAIATPPAPLKTASISQPAIAAAPQLAPAVTKLIVTTHSKSIYVVKSGDTLSHIAETHGTTIKSIKSANDLTNGHVLVGAKLKIPAV
ncbi:MAG TPA: LysM peptidoglycan-binding domain-containing protein [Verrucomicrobiae bacterium]